MTKQEYFFKLGDALKGAGLKNEKYVLSQYERYFIEKADDGYAEEEIISKLRQPFEIVPGKRKVSRAGKIALGVGLCTADLLAFLFMLVMCLLALSIFAAVIFLIYLGGGFLLGVNPLSMLKHFHPFFEDYWGGALFALSLIALSFSLSSGGVYYLSFLKKLKNCYVRFRYNLRAGERGEAILPPLAINAKVSKKLNRRLRNTILISLTAFALCFALGCLSCRMYAGRALFWREWGWFDE